MSEWHRVPGQPKFLWKREVLPTPHCQVLCSTPLGPTWFPMWYKGMKVMGAPLHRLLCRSMVGPSTSQEQRKFPCPESSHEECSRMLSTPGASGVHDRTPGSCMQAPIPASTQSRQGFTVLRTLISDIRRHSRNRARHPCIRPFMCIPISAAVRTTQRTQNPAQAKREKPHRPLEQLLYSQGIKDECLQPACLCYLTVFFKKEKYKQIVFSMRCGSSQLG